ncbi:MAG: PIG-L family deacetylase [Deltaproteobacteria bacterium]
MNDLLTLPLARPIDFTAAGGALRRLRTQQARSVLYFTAHPDDEDAATLTYLARGLGVRVALWCATRGEGGENHAGAEAGAALGARRHRELVAAAEWYGVEDVEVGDFSDFGYTTSLDATLERWDFASLVDAISAAIERHRPTFVMSRYVGAPSDGHGHHQAVGLAAREAVERSRGAPDVASSARAPSFGRPAPGLMVFDPTGDVVFDVGAPLPGFGLSAARLGAFGMAEHRTQHGGVLTEPSTESRRTYRTVASDAAFDSSEPQTDFEAELQRRRTAEAVAFERGLSVIATATPEGDHPFERFYDSVASFARPTPGARFVVDVRCEGPDVDLGLDAPPGWGVERLDRTRWAVIPDASRGALRVVAQLDGHRLVRVVQRRTMAPPHTRVAL